MVQMYVPPVNATWPVNHRQHVCTSTGYRVPVQDVRERERERLLLRDLRTGITEWLGTYSNLTIPSLSGAGTRAIGIVSRGCAGFNNPHNARLYYRRNTTENPEVVWVNLHYTFERKRLLSRKSNNFNFTDLKGANFYFHFVEVFSYASKSLFERLCLSFVLKILFYNNLFLR